VTPTTDVPADAGAEEEDGDDEDVPPLKPRYDSDDEEDDDEPVPPLEPYVDSDDEDEDDEFDLEKEVAVPHLPDSNTSVTSNNTGPREGTSLMDELSVAAAHVANAEMTEGGRFAQGTTNHTKRYTDRKKKLLCEFIEVLKKHGSKYERFLELTPNIPIDFPTQDPTEMVFLLLRGEENKAEKIRSLNGMIIDWVEGKRLKYAQSGGNTYPAPASINTMIRTFFAAAKDYYQWSFSQKDFTFDGGYNGFFKALCEKRRNEDVSIYCFNCECIFLQINNSHQSFNQTSTANIRKQSRQCPP
jgi:hypothetical protein